MRRVADWLRMHEDIASATLVGTIVSAMIYFSGFLMMRPALSCAPGGMPDEPRIENVRVWVYQGRCRRDCWRRIENGAHELASDDRGIYRWPCECGEAWTLAVSWSVTGEARRCWVMLTPTMTSDSFPAKPSTRMWCRVPPREHEACVTIPRPDRKGTYGIVLKTEGTMNSWHAFVSLE